VRSEAEAFEEAKTIKAREFLSDDLVMTIIGFRKFSRDYFGLGPAASDDKFNDLHKEQGGRDDMGTGPQLVKQVRQKDPISRDRSRSGTEHANGVRTQADITRDAFEVRKKTLDKRVSGIAEADSGSDEGDVGEEVEGETASAPPTLPSSVHRGANMHPTLTAESLQEQGSSGGSPNKSGGPKSVSSKKAKDGTGASVANSKGKDSNLDKPVPKADIDDQAAVDDLSSEAFIKKTEIMELEIQDLLKRLKGANGWLAREARDGRSEGGEEGRLDGGSQSQDSPSYVGCE
jgi:hypothetical protein